jgi:hypothetical protein
MNHDMKAEATAQRNIVNTMAAPISNVISIHVLGGTRRRGTG